MAATEEKNIQYNFRTTETAQQQCNLKLVNRTDKTLATDKIQQQKQ